MTGSTGSNLSIEKWNGNTKYLVKDFDCGNDTINGFLRKSLRSNVAKGYEQAFVLTEQDHRVMGFFTLHPFMIAKEDLKNSQFTGMPRMVSAIRLKMLGVDKSLQGQGVSTSLIKAALTVVARTLSDVGGVGLYLDADTPAVEFYKRLSFIELPHHSNGAIPMLLAKDTLLAAIAS